MHRIKPDPVPAIHPRPEHLVDARLGAVYADTKAMLGVPWMGVVTMAFAHYPTFYEALSVGLRQVCGTTTFKKACAQLRSHAESQVTALLPQGLQRDLSSLRYTESELAQIRALIEVFSAGNMPYLMIATIARMLLEDQALTMDASHRFTKEEELSVQTIAPLTLIEPHHAEAQTAAVYKDIRQTLGLPFVNTDYRALARWPSYFAMAWNDLQPKIATPAYQAIVESTHAAAINLTRTLSLPAALTGEVLRGASKRDASVHEVLEVVRLFQWLLPGLVINVAFFRAQLR